MIIKKEVSVGNIISIVSSVAMFAYMYGSTHFQVSNHEDRLKTLEASNIEMTKSITILATTMSLEKQPSQTINVK